MTWQGTAAVLAALLLATHPAPSATARHLLQQADSCNATAARWDYSSCNAGRELGSWGSKGQH